MNISCASCNKVMEQGSTGIKIFVCWDCRLSLNQSIQTGKYEWWSYTCAPHNVNYPVPFELDHPGIEFVEGVKK